MYAAQWPPCELPLFVQRVRPKTVRQGTHVQHAIACQQDGFGPQQFVQNLDVRNAGMGFRKKQVVGGAFPQHSLKLIPSRRVAATTLVHDHKQAAS